MSPRHNFGSRKIENSLSEKRTVGGFENFGGSSRNIFEMYWNRLCFYFSKIERGGEAYYSPDIYWFRRSWRKSSEFVGMISHKDEKYFSVRYGQMHNS